MKQKYARTELQKKYQGDVFLRQIASIRFLSRHMARTICLIRALIRSSINVNSKINFVFSQKNAARCISGQNKKMR